MPCSHWFVNVKPGTTAVADAGAPGTSSDSAAMERIQLQHGFLDAAKNFDWDAVVGAVTVHPALINAAPLGRWSALHQSAFAALPRDGFGISLCFCVLVPWEIIMPAFSFFRYFLWV